MLEVTSAQERVVVVPAVAATVVAALTDLSNTVAPKPNTPDA